MYQWVNPTTGRSQLSGKAPVWYRSDVGGPRILVFEKNVLVDDTAVAVNEEQRLQLRDKAFLLEPKERELTAAQAVATLEEQIQAIVESPAVEYLINHPSPTNKKSIQGNRKADATFDTAVQEEETENNRRSRESTDEKIERLTALVNTWDENNTEEAKSLLLEDENGIKEDLVDVTQTLIDMRLSILAKEKIVQEQFLKEINAEIKNSDNYRKERVEKDVSFKQNLEQEIINAKIQLQEEENAARK